MSETNGMLLPHHACEEDPGVQGVCRICGGAMPTRAKARIPMECGSEVANQTIARQHVLRCNECRRLEEARIANGEPTRMPTGPIQSLRRLASRQDAATSRAAGPFEAPCGAKLPSRQGLGGHKGRCPRCRDIKVALSEDPAVGEPPAASPRKRPPARLRAPCGRDFTTAGRLAQHERAHACAPTRKPATRRASQPASQPAFGWTQAGAAHGT